MKFFLSLLASVLIALAWLLPIHYRPWVTYTGETLAFLSLFALAAIYLKDRISLPLISLPLTGLALVPLLQWGVGEQFFFSKALMSCVFILGFWLSIVVGYNLSKEKIAREKVFTSLSYVFLIAGSLTGLMAICQWLTIDQYLSGLMVNLRGNRPFANFAQPNNMATFLVMSLLACLYLYEKHKAKTWILVPSALIMLLAVALSQSRTSWVACLFILGYLAYQSYKGYIATKWYYLIGWFAIFVGFIWLLPSASQWIAQLMDAPVQTREVVQRATGDMSRLAIWQQMIHAIADRPWFGYGWHQTSMAYVLVSEYFSGPVWIRSAHNFILDFLLWNGFVVGLPFLAYFAYWGYRLHRQVNSTESVIGIVMISAVLIHAMFEFPQNYAYFLLPLGFIIGLVQSQNTQTREIGLSPNYMRVFYALSVILLLIIMRDYSVAVEQINQAARYEKYKQPISNHQPIYLLSELDRRAKWIRMSPYTSVNSEQLKEIDEMVLNYPTQYDLLKYAKLLAFNGYEQEAKHQLWRLKQLRHVDVSYASIVEEQPKT